MNYPTITNKQILITGGAGFIGSNLCDNLIANHNKVICLDNLSTGNFNNISHLKENPNFTFIKGDIRSYETCQQAVKGAHAILHHAALGSVPRSISNPLASHEVNITGFLNMLQAAKEEGIKRFIYASSSSVYGDHPGLPKREELLGKPLSPYAVTKRANELYAQSFSSLYPELQIIGLRYFNVFGPRQTPDGPYAAAIPKFIQALLQHQSPVIYGNGTQSRDFTYIENVIQANHLALTTSNPEAFNEVYNIGTGVSLNLNDLVTLLREYLSKYDSEIQNIAPQYAHSRAGDVPHSLALIDKAKKILGYQPFYSAQQGLQHSMDWYWSKLNIETPLELVP